MPVKKRELAAYLVLLSTGEEIPIERARTVLSTILSRKGVRSVLRVLSKSGFIEIRGARVLVRSPERALGAYLSGYIASRILRLSRSRRSEVRVLNSDGVERISVDPGKGERILVRISGILELDLPLEEGPTPSPRETPQ